MTLPMSGQPKGARQTTGGHFCDSGCGHWVDVGDGCGSCERGVVEPTTLTQAQHEVCRNFCGNNPSAHDPVCSLIVAASPLCGCPVEHEYDCPEWGHPSDCDCGRT